jgi:NADH-quinone oxidoreductase subunit L
MLRAGDIAFLAGIVLAYHLYGTVQFAPLFERAVADPMQLALLGGLKMSGATAVALLIFIGAMSKSAQVPLHMWLPDSLYAPTPIHALLHAGIINAGGFLLNRLAPLYALSSTTLHVVFAVGLVTAIVGASMMLVQNDIKKTLGYSTIGQMGGVRARGLLAGGLSPHRPRAVQGLDLPQLWRRDSPESPRPPTTTACYDSAT